MSRYIIIRASVLYCVVDVIVLWPGDEAHGQHYQLLCELVVTCSVARLGMMKIPR